MTGPLLTLWLLLLGAAAPSQDHPARAAWAALQRGDAAKAAAAFREALAAAPDDATLHLGAGVAAHLLGRDDHAVASLARAVRLDPKLVQAAMLLGQIAYARGDLDGAIDAYRRAQLAAPQNPAIAEQLSAWRQEAELHGRFDERPGVRFRVLFEGRRDQTVADRVARVLESAYWRIGRALDSYPAETITVILYTERQFRDVTHVPGWSGGVYDGRIRIAVEGALKKPTDLDRLVVHEFVHAAVVQLATRGVPAWLHEGLASYFEPGDRGWVGEVLSTATLMPLGDLVDGFEHVRSEHVAVAYAESELAARILVERLGVGISAFLQGLGNGQSLDDQLSLFGLTRAELESELSRRAARGGTRD